MPATSGAIIIGISSVVTSTFSKREPLSATARNTPMTICSVRHMTLYWISSHQPMRKRVSLASLVKFSKLFHSTLPMSTSCRLM